MACYVYPLLFSEKRNFHGVTLHEIDTKLDNGKIYRATRFPVENMTGAELFLRTFEGGKEMLEDVCQKLVTGCQTTELVDSACTNEKWGEHYFSGKYEKELVKDLPRGHTIREMVLLYIHNNFDTSEIINESYPLC
ncbi:MAG: hypothetical protein PHD53_02775 [Methylococcales bacterium]|nr:hypothetical protein [Methylococcales bacterium]